MKTRPTFAITCPDCGAEMVIDAATGETLSHRSAKKAPRKKADFDALLAGLDDSKSRADAIFAQELSALKNRDQVLEEKFKRELERAEEEDDGKAPIRPWDLD